jgi:hypothetical protein
MYSTDDKPEGLTKCRHLLKIGQSPYRAPGFRNCGTLRLSSVGLTGRIVKLALRRNNLDNNSLENNSLATRVRTPHILVLHAKYDIQRISSSVASLGVSM